MKGRIVITKLLPTLNLLVNNGVVSPVKMQAYASQKSAQKTLTLREVINDLMGFDIPEDKYEEFSGVINILENIEGGNKNVQS